MGKLFSVIRLLLGIVLAWKFMMSMTYFGQPFGGCEDQGFSTLARGCSLWPLFLRSIGAFLIVALMTPSHSRPHAWGMGFIALLAILGGPFAIMTREFFTIMDYPLIMLYFWFGDSAAVVLGGCVGLVLYLLIERAFRAILARVNPGQV